MKRTGEGNRPDRVRRPLDLARSAAGPPQPIVLKARVRGRTSAAKVHAAFEVTREPE